MDELAEHFVGVASGELNLLVLTQWPNDVDKHEAKRVNLNVTS